MKLDPITFFRNSPFHGWLSCDVEQMDPEGVVLHLAFRPEFTGDREHPAYHGGVLCALIDAAGTFALIAATDRDWVTVDLRVDFQRIAGPRMITARARPVGVGRTMGLADVTLTDDADNTLALGRLRLSAVPSAEGRGTAGET